jgi:ABC-type protease/lipase transport system fused ATPase/permease subunit
MINWTIQEDALLEVVCALRAELASMRQCFEAADRERSELRARAERARQAALIEAAEICDQHANEWPKTIAAVLRSKAKETGNE